MKTSIKKPSQYIRNNTEKAIKHLKDRGIVS